jgi:UTP--glucose-1-phosphate uridylyltransferase
MWGDEFFFAPKKPHLAQLMEVFDQYQGPVLTGYEVDEEGTEKYGILDAALVSKNVYQVKTIVEKPGPKRAPSRLAALGGDVLTPDIFAAFEKTKLGKGGELWLPDAIAILLKRRTGYACKVEGTYYDTGSKLGYLKANVDFALRDKKLQSEFRKYLKSVI